jgi:hypothetical protein
LPTPAAPNSATPRAPSARRRATSASSRCRPTSGQMFSARSAGTPSGIVLTAGHGVDAAPGPATRRTCERRRRHRRAVEQHRHLVGEGVDADERAHRALLAPDRVQHAEERRRPAPRRRLVGKRLYSRFSEAPEASRTSSMRTERMPRSWKRSPEPPPTDHVAAFAVIFATQDGPARRCDAWQTGFVRGAYESAACTDRNPSGLRWTLPNAERRLARARGHPCRR